MENTAKETKVGIAVVKDDLVKLGVDVSKLGSEFWSKAKDYTVQQWDVQKTRITNKLKQANESGFVKSCRKHKVEIAIGGICLVIGGAIGATIALYND